MSRKPVKVVRYWPGKAPEKLDDDSSSEEEQAEEQQIQIEEQQQFIQKNEQQPQRDIGQKETFLSKFKSIQEQDTNINKTTVKHNIISKTSHNLESEDEESEDEERRHALLRMRALKLRQQQENESDESDSDDSLALNLPKPIFTKPTHVSALETQKNKPEESESESEESSEEESSSESEDDERVILKPVFIPKKHRETVLEKEKMENEAKEAEEKRIAQLEDRKKESHKIAQEEIKKELDSLKEETEVPDVDDTDGINEEEEYAAWKLRELKRIKRDRIEQAQREQEILDIERRRGMTDAEIIAEDEKTKPKKEKGKISFLQKYYHKGAFFADEEILQRDYSAATLEDKVDKTNLPAVMQVKNFGKAGRSKWTHLAKEDTSKKDVGWAVQSEINKRVFNKLGGYKDSSFDKPSKKHKSN